MFKEIYPDTQHFIAPHPIYYDILSMGLNPNECRRQLKLPINKKIVLAFGQFRSEDEIQMFLKLRKSVNSNVVLFAQRIETGRINNGFQIGKTIKCLKNRISLYHRNFLYGQKRVDEQMIPIYFTAADIVFIQRKKILNSGNVPMAISAGKPVVGPLIGNVGKLLLDTGNFGFNPNSDKSIAESVNKALLRPEIGISNHKYAIMEMNPNRIFQIIDYHLKRYSQHL